MTEEDRTTPTPPPADEPVVPDPAMVGEPVPGAALVPTEEPAVVPATEVTPPVTGPRRPPIVPILAVATAILLVTTILFGLMAFAPRIAPIKTETTRLAARAVEEKQVTDIAERFARNFVTIDYRTIDADLKRMTADATGSFKEKLERTIKVVGASFRKQKARSTGRILDSATVTFERNNALIQVLIRRTKQNVGTGGPDSGNQVVNVSLVKTSDGWKVDDLSEVHPDEKP